MASIYKLSLATIVIILLIFLWIPFNEVLNESGGVLESFNNASTEASTINYNNTGGKIFYYSLFIMIVIILIWVIKEERGSSAYE